MASLLALALAFPTVIFTVLLGVVLVYWLFVVLGAMHIDVLGSGADGAFEGAHIDVGGLDGGSLDGMGAHADVGGFHGADGADGAAGGDHVDIADNGGIHGIVEAMRLRSAPATVVLSLLITFSWLVSVFATRAATHLFSGAPGLLTGSAVFVLAILVALPITSLAVRPLAPLFVPHVAKGRNDLVGKVCIIRTGSVDDRFGEATLEDGGAGLVVRVRVDAGDALRRGDQALIVGWDAERQSFTVSPIDDVLAKREGLDANVEDEGAASGRRRKS